MRTDPQLIQLHEIMSGLYECFLNYYSGVDGDIQTVLKSYPSVEALGTQREILAELYLAVDKGDKECEFVYCLDRLLSELNMEFSEMRRMGEDYVINDWTSIVIHQLKMFVDIFEEDNEESPVKVVKLSRPLSEILERENQSALARVLRRYRAGKKSAEKYEQYAKRKVLQDIHQKQVNPAKSNPAYNDPHLASALPYTQRHLR